MVWAVSIEESLDGDPCLSFSQSKNTGKYNAFVSKQHRAILAFFMLARIILNNMTTFNQAKKEFE